MEKSFQRLEYIVSSLERAVVAGDRIQCYRLSVVALRLLIEHHKQLEVSAESVKAINTRLANIPTKEVKHPEYYRTAKSWGMRSHTVGTPGNQLRPLNVLNAEQYHKLVTESVMLQMKYNEELQLLQQYASAFDKARTEVIELHPRNEQQRLIQCVLSRSEVRSTWSKDSIKENPVLGVICGRFYDVANMVRLTNVLLKTLDDTKRKIGRFSLALARKVIHANRSAYYKLRHERYIIGRAKASRGDNVYSYVSNSPRYQKQLSWIVGLSTIQHALTVLPYAECWKEQYKAVDRLCRSIAVKRDSYVKTLFTGQPVQVDTILHLETNVPVYRADCICWESSTESRQWCYYLGRTGSPSVDSAIQSVDWFHVPTVAIVDADAVALRSLRYRLGYTRGQATTLAGRRKEIAAYARKLVWLESISMLDSKNAGNCLPGTLQFCHTLGVDVPNNWADVRVDTRKLLRAWKQNTYGVNRLLLPAIDTAVNRVKSEISAVLLPLTAVYVPSIVR